MIPLLALIPAFADDPVLPWRLPTSFESGQLTAVDGGIAVWVESDGYPRAALLQAETGHWREVDVVGSREGAVGAWTAGGVLVVAGGFRGNRYEESLLIRMPDDSWTQVPTPNRGYLAAGPLPDGGVVSPMARSSSQAG